MAELEGREQLHCPLQSCGDLSVLGIVAKAVKP